LGSNSNFSFGTDSSINSMWKRTSCFKLVKVNLIKKNTVKKFNNIFVKFLCNSRYAFTVGSNIFVYVVAYLLLKYKDDSHDNNLSPGDAPKFMILTFIVCGVGLLFQIIFHVGIKEDNSREEYQRDQPSRNFVVQRNLDWRGYLKSFKFYQVCFKFKFKFDKF
jgi:hypothetical protein